MHAKSGLRVLLEWKINRPDSVITAVIPLGNGDAQMKLRYGIRTLLVATFLIASLIAWLSFHFHRGERQLAAAKTLLKAGFATFEDDQVGNPTELQHVELTGMKYSTGIPVRLLDKTAFREILGDTICVKYTTLLRQSDAACDFQSLKNSINDLPYLNRIVFFDGTIPAATLRRLRSEFPCLKFEFVMPVHRGSH